jgi:hypothetical protein
MRTKQTLSVLTRCALSFATLFVLSFQWTNGAGAQPAPAALKVGTNSIPLSVFIDDEQGRDPFFPNSTRRQFKAPVPDIAPVVGPTSLVVLGILGEPGNRYALINNQSFRAGEEIRVRIPGGSSLVKCEEIRESSVIVTIQGGTERFEIHLLERTLPIAPERQGIE